MTCLSFAPFIVLGALGLGDDGPLPRAPALAPAEALKTFQVRGGFHLELLAAEPMVISPVAAAYDEDGRLYVAEMVDYPHVDPANDKPFQENHGDPPIGRVRLLIDRDGDGAFDESHVFADKLSWPTGIVVWKGGVFVAATPEVWYLRDRDGDHRADERRQVYTGFRKYNVQAVMNNFQWGLDHWIYGAGSSNGGLVRTSAKPDGPAVNLLRRDFRFDPVGGRFEAISGGARFGNTFDDWGNRFLCDIRNPAQHVVLPARYLARNPYLPVPRALHDAAEHGDAIRLFRISPPEPWRALRARRWTELGKRMPRSELVGAGSLTSSSGLTVYRGDAYPPEYRGNLFLGEVANNLVHRMALAPDGATFRAQRADAGAEFLASTDTWFRPVNFVNAPDGTLTVLDMYRETIEHPWSIPDDIRARLDLRSGANRGRLYRLAPPGIQPRKAPHLSAASTEELVKLLEHANGWHRATAHRLLFERQDRAAVAPLKKLLRASRTPLGRLHALHSLAGLSALDDADLLSALADGSPRVREHAVALAEPRLAGSLDLRSKAVQLAHDPDARVRFQLAFTLGAVMGNEACDALATIARRDAADPWIRTAVLSSAAVDPVGLFDRLARDRSFAIGASGGQWLRALAHTVGARGRSGEPARVLAIIASAVPDDDAGRAAALGLAEGLSRSRKRLASLRPALNESAARWLDHVFQESVERARDGSADPERRARAIAFLGQGPPETVLEVVPRLLATEQPPAVQAAAARALADLDRPDAARLLLAPWKSYTPARRSEAAALLLGRRSGIGPLLDAIAAGTVAPGTVPVSRRNLLMADRDPKIRETARRFFADDAPGPRAQALAQYRAVLQRPGDPQRGRAVFDRECLACHKLGARGHAVGPNLASVRNKTPEEILNSVLDPNREVSPEFLEFHVALDDGRTVAGIIAAETPSGITVRAKDGVEQTVARQSVEAIAGTGKSLMPEGLEKNVNPSEMADLIAYLLKIQGE